MKPKPIRTLNEARALAAARRRQWESREKFDPAHAAALAKWRAPFVLTRNLLGKFRAQ